MKVDFHVPTAPLTKKALHKPVRVFEAAKASGHDGVILTETNVVRSYPAFMQLHDLARARFGLTLYQGLYLHTTLGPILVYGQSIAQAGEGGVKFTTAPDTIAAVDYCIEQGWAVVLAHPFQYGIGHEQGMCYPFKSEVDPIASSLREIGHVIRMMHGIEISGSASKRDNDFAEGLANELNLPLLVGSGACYPTQIKPGCYTKIPQSLGSGEAIARALVGAAKGEGRDRFRLPELRGIYKAGRHARITRTS